MYTKPVELPTEAYAEYAVHILLIFRFFNSSPLHLGKYYDMKS